MKSYMEIIRQHMKTRMMPTKFTVSRQTSTIPFVHISECLVVLLDRVSCSTHSDRTQTVELSVVNIIRPKTQLHATYKVFFECLTYSSLLVPLKHIVLI